MNNNNDHQQQQQQTLRRLNSRQSDSQDRRNSMNKRRHDLANKIRKQKRSDYIARKRNIFATESNDNNNNNSNSSISTSNNIETVGKNIRFLISNPGHDALQELKLSLSAACKEINNSKNNVLLQLPNFSENPLVFITQDEYKTVGFALIDKLQQIISTAQPQQDYQTIQVVLSIIVQLSSIHYSLFATDDMNYYGRPPISWCWILIQNSTMLSLLLTLAGQYESASITLGNIAGDGTMTVLSVLRQSTMVPTLVQILKTTTIYNNNNNNNNPQQENIQLQEAAAWALTNLIRNDTTIYASEYCSHELLSPMLLEQMLSQSLSNTAQPSSLSIQAAWMIASLTSRESDAVNYLCSSSSFCPTLCQVLASSTNHHHQQQQQPPTQNETIQIPLLEALGNIATHENHVMSLVPLLTPILVSILLQPQNNHNNTVIISRAIWISGCLLFDAGIDQHASTTIAAPALVPVLVNLLLAPFTTSDLLASITSALWNAVSPPPDPSTSSLSLVQISLPNNVLPKLVQLLSSHDYDTVMSSVCILDRLLRQNNTLQITIEEVGGVDALDKVCDSGMEEPADIAAELLDDFFYLHDDDDDNTNEPFNAMNLLPPGVGFINVQQVQQNDNNISQQQQQPITFGLGRGRGAIIPSWMSK